MKQMWRSKPKGRLYTAAHCIFGAAIIVLIILSHAARARAQQNKTQHTTDPDEVRALNSVFQKLGIMAKGGAWNISGDLCSGHAIDATDINDPDYSPFIKCNCSFNGGSTCYITQLKVSDPTSSVSGTIPEELWSLTHLTNLNLSKNVLTGPLSPSIGNLTQMQYLDLSINALTGILPKELGMLSNLITLNFRINRFSGHLPSELGNLTKLEKLYIDSAGVSGPFPSTFAHLRRLNELLATDNELTGPIPDFIGSWTQLTHLSLVGNSFEGPIPLSFSTLTSLTDLRIGGVLNGSSSLEFIKDMRNLIILILRNNNISGFIPSTIGEYSGLTLLDLSFNNLYGQIPNSLFELKSLSFLFLGNNSLNGTLPAQKGSSLNSIDLSYNFLTGSFPSWVSSQNNINLNLVGNTFTMINGNFSNLPSGLNCLQRNFPCHRENPNDDGFAIKCGGREMKSSHGIVYERDNSTLGQATYYVADSQRWAVSNSGYFTDENNPSYIFTSQSQFTSTLDPEFYQTSRISTSSLRYYGLGLQNGNYTVNLQFAESVLTNANWGSHGRRVFDIYIQGNIEAKDFDIRKEAGGKSLVAVLKTFNAVVKDNYIEIHLFWAGKGTCSFSGYGPCGPIISAISTTFNPIHISNNHPSTNKKKQTGLIVGILIGVASVGFLAALVLFLVGRKKLCHAYEDEELLRVDTRLDTFSYAELKVATDEFSTDNKLGEGGFGPVFKGTLDDGRVIAVKHLSLTSHQGRNQFVTEIETISAVQHLNLVKLYGCCIEGDKRLIVYEYLENKSLDQALYGQKCLNLGWSTRYAICLGIARGLAYLHEESRLRIVHRDVKASNILLDCNLTPKISDFGLAKLYVDKKTHISTNIAGTYGYLAPEYAMRGHLTEKADVFAFGVVALEVLSGRPNTDKSLMKHKVYLLEWAWNLYEEKREIELVDPRLSDFNEEEVKRVIGIALLCTQTSPRMRPAMSRVVSMLVGDIEVSSVTTRPEYFTECNYTDESITTGSSKNMPPSSTTSTTGYQLFMTEILGQGR